MTFDEFLPEYLDAHTDPRTQVVHAIGTFGALTLLALAIVACEAEVFPLHLADPTEF